MKLLYNSVFTLAAGVMILAACSSKPKTDNNEPPTLSPPAPLDTKALLAYNPKNADKAIDAEIEKLHKTRGFNGNVLVAKHGKIVYERALGWADYLHRDSLKIGSQFELASITKTITSTAILQLVERGKIK